MSKFIDDDSDSMMAMFDHVEDDETDSDDLAGDIKEMIDEVETRIGRDLTDDEREAFVDEYLKQLDDDESEIIENWCNQYGGDTCKEGKDKTGGTKKVKVPKEKKEKVKKEIKAKVKAKRERAPKKDKHVEKIKEAVGGKKDDTKPDSKFDFSKALSELKTERETGKAKEHEEKSKRGLFHKAWGFLTGNTEDDDVQDMLSAAVDAMEERLGRDLTDDEIDQLTDELVEEE